MKLSFEQIKNCTKGAVRVKDFGDYINFFRFTEAQQVFYEGYDEAFYRKSFATAGVRLSFVTDSEILNIKGAISSVFASTRKYYSFDVKVNGEYIGSIDNYGDTKFEGNYSKIELPLDDFDKTIDLGIGKKTVEIYFPYTVRVNLKEVNLSDGALVEPTPQQDKMLMFGDSITQGYDSLRNIHHYTAQLGDALGMEIINKGIGGEVFKPELARCREPYDPKIVTVAYGTNDWSKRTPEVFTENCREFYKAVSELYPDAKIFGITPPWNKNFDNTSKPMTFSELADKIEELTSDLENVTIISGDDLIPHDEKYFGDLFVHPNNDGFDCYFKNLYSKIKKLL